MSLNFIQKYKLKALYKQHPKKVCAFLSVKKISDVTLQNVEFQCLHQLFALTKQDWEDWEHLLSYANTLLRKYKSTVISYMNENFEKSQIDTLTLNELRLMSMESDSYWLKRIKMQAEADALSTTQINGVILYKTIHKDSGIKDIVKHANEIQELQNRYDFSLKSKNAIHEFNLFSEYVSKLVQTKTTRNDIIYHTYQINVYDVFGKMEFTNIQYCQISRLAYSSYRLEEQGATMQKRYSYYTDFVSKKIHWNADVCNQYIELITDLYEKYSDLFCAIFVTSNSDGVLRDSYIYNYKYILRELKKRDIPCYDLNKGLWRHHKFQYYLLIDFFTTHEDMNANIQTILQTHDITPSFAYLSITRKMTDMEVEKCIKQQGS